MFIVILESQIRENCPVKALQISVLLSENKEPPGDCMWYLLGQFISHITKVKYWMLCVYISVSVPCGGKQTSPKMSDLKQQQSLIIFQSSGLTGRFFCWSGLWSLLSACSQSCPILCDPRGYNPPGCSVHGIFQARILKWVASSSSRGSSWPQGSNLHLMHLLHWQADSLPTAPPGKPYGLSGDCSRMVAESGDPTGRVPPLHGASPNVPSFYRIHEVPYGFPRELSG